jgi:hypothetical protein
MNHKICIIQALNIHEQQFKFITMKQSPNDDNICNISLSFITLKK